MAFWQPVTFQWYCWTVHRIYPVSFDLGLDIIVFCIDLVSVFPFTNISHSEITFIPEFPTEVRKGVYSKAENFGHLFKFWLLLAMWICVNYFTWVYIFINYKIREIPAFYNCWYLQKRCLKIMYSLVTIEHLPHARTVLCEAWLLPLINLTKNCGTLWYLQGNERELKVFWQRHLNTEELTCWRMKHSGRGTSICKNIASEKCKLQVVQCVSKVRGDRR